MDTVYRTVLCCVAVRFESFTNGFLSCLISFYAEIDGMKTYSSRIEQCLKNVEHHWPQYRIDGTRNIWISKPGAKSRGRGFVR